MSHDPHNAPPLCAPTQMDKLIQQRFSARAYLPQPVPEALLKEVLTLALQAPSGSNTQPWRVYVLRDAAKQRLCQRVCCAHDEVAANPALAEQYSSITDEYPERWFEPFQGRRRENGWGLYKTLGIQRGQRAQMHAQHQANFRFFDAPVGLIFTLHRAIGRAAVLDYGMFLQTLMLSAQARGLHTCAQGAWLSFGTIVLDEIAASPQERLVCGMALGYADPDAPANHYRSPRDPLDTFTTWLEH